MTGKSLVRTSDQMVEACHQYLKKLLRRSSYWVKDPLSEMCGRQLLAGILHFNGYSATRMGLVMVDSVSEASSLVTGGLPVQ